MSRRDPHPVDPTRRRRIENPDEYERGRRDGQQPDPKPDPKPTYTDRGGWPYELSVAVGAVLILALCLLGADWAITEIQGW